MPTDLVATTISAAEIRLTWQDNADDEQNYRIERSTDGTTFTDAGVVTANVTTWSNTGLTAQTTCFYRVRATAGAAASAYSNTATATTGSAPIAPSNLVATTLGPDGVRMSWQDNAGDEQYYRVERSTDGVNFNQVALLLANTTSWTSYSLAPDTAYFYRVRASAGAAYSGYSNTAAATTSPPPATPGDLALSVLGPDSIRLTWTDNATTEQFYRVERSVDGTNFVHVAVLGANTTSWTNTGLLPTTAYTYRVRASAGSIYSGYSNAATATTAPPPAAPSNLTASALSNTSVRLTWSDNATSEQYYRIERSTDGVTFSPVAILLANSTSWTNYALTAGTTYSYRVRASVGTIYSPYSEVVAVVPGAP
ncbi:MAG: fibronectin type III domain-containing protein [Dehalococcoidia bacterium]